MPNPIFNPQPNYSGVTIQIANPAVNVNPYGVNENLRGIAVRNGQQIPCQNPCCTNNFSQTVAVPPETTNSQYGIADTYGSDYQAENGYQTGTNYQAGTRYQTNPIPQYGQAYPAQYYLNNYNYQGQQPPENIGFSNKTPNGSAKAEEAINIIPDNSQNEFPENGRNINPNVASQYESYADSIQPKEAEDLTASYSIISDLERRNQEIKEAKKNSKETKIVALTDDYIRSLENYLNNPDDEIRLMASKEILTRLDEDKDRFDDAALNALLNKMLQDPSKLIRLAALSAFASQLACGNDFTVQLLQRMQSDPNGDKEDALQASDILLKMSAGVEVKNIPQNVNQDQNGGFVQTEQKA